MWHPKTRICFNTTEWERCGHVLIQTKAADITFFLQGSHTQFKKLSCKTTVHIIGLYVHPHCSQLESDWKNMLSGPQGNIHHEITGRYCHLVISRLMKSWF